MRLPLVLTRRLLPSRKRPLALPASFLPAQRRAVESARQTPGYLSDREARFLFTLGAAALGEGDILEIGSFKGRSTVVIASGIQWRTGHTMLLSVDPHTAPSSTDPDLKGDATSWDHFLESLRRTGLSGLVTPHRETSQDFATHFTGHLSVLWIDGDHTTEGARHDVRGFLPRLVPGGIVAMHDVLGTWEGSLRVFCEEILASDDFGAAGFCGSIGWAQYLPGAGGAISHRLRRKLLAIPARNLIPVAAAGQGLQGWNKLRYKFWRPLAPHGEVSPETWARRVGASFVERR